MMKAKRAFLAISIAALVLTIIPISQKAYYVAAAIVVGVLIIGYREIWSLVRTKRMPPVDERVKENVNKSIRNGFIFFVMASIFLMLGLSMNVDLDLDTIHLLGGLFLSSGAIYLLSYVFYDRSEPKLSEKALKMLKVFLILAGISLAVFIISVFLHNIISGLLNVEEPVFFIIAVIISPLAFAAGIIGSLVIFIKGLAGKAN